MTNLLKLFIAGFIILSSFGVQAQKAVTIAFDPLTTAALGGYEVEVGFNLNKNRITAAYLSGDLSPWFGDVAEYNSAKHDFIEISWSRFLGDNQTGLSYGLAYTYYTDFTVENALGESLTKNPSRISLKLAYAWFPFSSIPLYLEPGMTFGFMVGDEDLNFSSGETFDKKSFMGNGPLFNVGYKFNL